MITTQTRASRLPAQTVSLRGKAGFTLVELMVAMVLGLVVIGGALLVYVNSSSSHRAQQSTAIMVENGRTAIELLSRDLRMAEYWHCTGWQSANLSNHLPGYEQRGIYSANGANGAPDSLRVLRALDETRTTVTAAVTLSQLDTSVTPATTTTNDISVDDGSAY